MRADPRVRGGRARGERRHAPSTRADGRGDRGDGGELAGTAGDDFIDADLRFHLAIAGATRNRLVLHSMHAVRDVLRRALLTVYQIPGEPGARSRRAPRDPRRDRAGDAARARDGMRDAPGPRRDTTSRRETRVADLGYVGLGVMGSASRAPAARRRARRYGLEPHPRRRPSRCSRPARGGPRPRARSRSGARSSSRWSRTPRRCRRSPRAPTGSSPASRDGKVYVDMSTAEPANARGARRPGRRGSARSMLDAPVSGSVGHASSRARLSVMVGGERGGVRARPAGARGDRAEGLPHRRQRRRRDDEDRDQPLARRADARLQRGRAARREERDPARDGGRGDARQR